MSALDFVVPAHHSKSKSTLVLTKELAVASPCIANNLARSYAEAKLQDSAGRKVSGSTLVGELSVNMLASDTDEDADDASVDAYCTSTQTKLEAFNKSLSRFANSNIYVVTLPRQLRELLDLFYLAENSLPLLLEMFPYLHGLASMKQRVYFHDKFDPGSDLDLLTGDASLLPKKFPHNTDVKVPDLAFHLLTVNSLECDEPKLINSVSVDDLLTFKLSYVYTPESDDFDYTAFEKFDSVYQLQDLSESLELMNRNYELQIKMVAPLSNFLIYNNSMNFYANSEAARAIKHLMGPLLSRSVYVVDFDCGKWLQMGDYLDVNSKCSILDQSFASDLGPIHDRLSFLEQKLIWLLNGIKELFPRFYIGNVYNFKQLVSSGQMSSLYDFKLHIYCHESAKLPSLGAINLLFNKIESEGLTEPIHIEFPDSIIKHGVEHISPRETLSYLNVMKLINLVVNKFKKKAFAYSFDGFTGITLLSLSLGLFWGPDSTEDVICSVFRKSSFKFYFLQGDYNFLKNFEVYIQWFKRQTLKDFNLIIELPLSKVNENYRPYPKLTDWFQDGVDINFPSQMYDNLFLGSVEHASSTTVVNTLKINRIVSIDEKPSWFKYLKCTFEHEATAATQGPVVKPIYVFNNGTAHVYEIVINSAVESKLFHYNAPIPDLKSIIYIHNVRDDGKDSMLPLLVDCPESIQRKFLVDPRDSMRTLVHCRIGVSRSASLVIASMMKYFGMDVVESYMYVRVRRFNVIIQPNLRIFYELFLLDEALRKRRYGYDFKKKHCWWVVCEQIHRLNQQYMA